MAAESASAAPRDEGRFIAALRAGDEEAFLELVHRHHPAMVRIARTYVSTAAAAEEVAQEAWLGVLQGLAGFEGRSSLRAWIFRILANTARTRGSRDARSVPLSSLEAEDDDGPTVDPERFLHGHPRWDGHWAASPRPFPEAELLSAETAAFIREVIARLPSKQRQVITLRDVEQWTSDEVCEALAITEGNQRVLLHRGRAAVRAALERHFGQEDRR